MWFLRKIKVQRKKEDKSLLEVEHFFVIALEKRDFQSK